MSIRPLPAPPITAPVSDAGGRMTPPWSAWMRDLFVRIGQTLGRTTTAIDADVATLGTSAADLGATIAALGTRVSTLESGPVAPSYTVATVPAASGHVGKTIFVSNESGGAVLAFSDGTAWRRVTDRAVIS